MGTNLDSDVRDKRITCQISRHLHAYFSATTYSFHWRVHYLGIVGLLILPRSFRSSRRSSFSRGAICWDTNMMTSLEEVVSIWYHRYRLNQTVDLSLLNIHRRFLNCYETLIMECGI